MLGKTAGGLFWMFRYLERSENAARMIEAGFRITLTRPDNAADEWASVLRSSGTWEGYMRQHGTVEAASVIDFLLRDRENPSSVICAFTSARNNARLVRTALTREVWEAVNEAWMSLKTALARPVRERDLPEVLGLVRQQSALVRGALHGTMLRNDGFDFARLGTFLERADNTARILDVKYYVLLPTVSHVGSALDNVQWETILRSVSGQRAFRWLHGGDISPMAIAEFLILDERMPRSLRFCVEKLWGNLGYLARDYGSRPPCCERVDGLFDRLRGESVERIFDYGLHEYLTDFLAEIAALGGEIERDYRFTG